MYTVYGRDNCPYCVKATGLLESLNLSYTYKDVGTDKLSRKELRGRAPAARTVPQIFHGDDLIGGYEDLESAHSRGELV